MCGIVGFISSANYGLNAKQADVFETMLFLDTQRGWDSTGSFGVQRNNNVYIAKDAVHGADFICTKEFTELRHKMIASGQFWVGHNRWATRGEVTDKNAHPFWVEDKVVLVQNGTMRGDHKKHKDVEVDTEALAHVIAENDDISVALNKIDASYALVWYNVNDKTLYMIRNTERPLYTVESTAGDILFASEENMILYSAYKHELKLKGKPVMLEPMMLQKYKLKQDGGFTHEQEKITIKPKYQEVHSPHSNFSQPWRQACGYSELCDEDYELDPVAASIRAIDNARTTQPTGRVYQIAQVKQDAPRDVNVDFSAYIFAKYPQLHLSQEQRVNASSRIMRDQNNGNETAVVQLEDYFPANNNKDCKVWFVFGRDISPGNSDVLYYWLVWDKAESDILEMCSNDSYFNIKPSGYQVRSATISGEDRFVVARFISSQERITMDDHNNAVH